MGAAVGGRGNLGPAGGRGAGGWGYNPPSSVLGSPASASWVNRSQGHGSPGDVPRGQPLSTEPGREGQDRGLEGQMENNTQHGKDGTERERSRTVERWGWKGTRSSEVETGMQKCWAREREAIQQRKGRQLVRFCVPWPCFPYSQKPGALDKTFWFLETWFSHQVRALGYCGPRALPRCVGSLPQVDP